MTTTEKLAEELFEVGNAICAKRYKVPRSNWKEYGKDSPIFRAIWVSIARHVLRREAKLRKAKR